jgi:CMP-N,N'-diacetyllegionaminic acid synthase
MKIVTFIPARGGSKGIPGKNIRLVNGTPLIHYNIIASLNSKSDETWVSSDSDNILEISGQCSQDIKLLKRPDELANDTASSESALLHFAENVDFDIVVFLQCTSPLTLSKDINNAIDLMDKYDSVISVCKDHGGWLCGGFNWYEGGKAEYDINNRPRRQDMTPRYRENGAIYITTKNGLLNSKCRLNGNVGLYTMPRQRSFEIDEKEDLKEIEMYLRRKE